MALLRIGLVVWFCCFWTINGAVLDNQQEDADFPQAYVKNFLEYLNNKPDRLHNYHYEKFIDAHKEGHNRVTLTIDVVGECRTDIPNPSCVQTEFVCEGLVRQINNAYQTHQTSGCQPKPVLQDKITETPTPQQQKQDELVHVQFRETQQEAAHQEEHENEAPLSSEQFVHVGPAYCAGCPVDLDKNVEGIHTLLETALQHVESERSNKHVVLNVLRVQRQIVAGVKYILLLEIAPTVCPKSALNFESCPLDTSVIPQVCEVVYLQKPWISRSKQIINNNCTSSQEFTVKPELPNYPRRLDQDNEIDITNNHGTDEHPEHQQERVPNFERIAETGQLGDQALADLESQIISVNDDSIKTENDLMLADQPHKEKKCHKDDDDDDDDDKDDKHSKRHGKKCNKKDDDDDDDDKKKGCKDKKEHKKDNKEKDDDDDDDKKHAKALKKDNKDDKDDDCAKGKNDDQSSSSSSSSSDSSSSSSDSSSSPCDSSSSSSSSSGSDSSSSSSSSSDSGSSSSSSSSDSSSSSSDSSSSSSSSSSDSSSSSSDSSSSSSDSSKSSSSSSDSSSSSSSDSSSSSSSDSSSSSSDSSSSSSDSTTKSSSSDSSSSSSSSEDCDEDEKEKSKRGKRSLPVKHLEKINPDERDLVKHLAGITANTLDSIDEDDRRRVVLQILGAKKNVLPDGINYHLTLRVGVSRCLENSDEKEHLCKENIIENLTKICRVQILVSEDKLSPQILKSTCSNIKKTDVDKNRTVRGKRHARERHSFVVGGITDLDLTEPKIEEFLNGGLLQLDSQSNSENKYKVVRVLGANKQLVAGSLYRIKAEVVLSNCNKKDQTAPVDCEQLQGSEPKICNFKIWDRPWLPDGREINVTCEESRKKRQIGVPGGITPADTNDPEVQEFVEGALVHLDSQSEGDNKVKVIRILEATQQVVSGSMHRIKVEVGVTKCSKKDSTKRESCELLEGTQPRICHIQVWDQPWLPQGRETNITCTEDQKSYSFRSKREATLEKEDKELSLGLFKNFMKTYGKTYPTDSEFRYRYKVFRQNLKKIYLLNKYEQGTAIYGPTEFTDLTKEEFRKRLGLRRDLKNDNGTPFPQAAIPDVELPVEFDWRSKGVVSEVKNQGMCGSCWAFSVTGNVEGQYALKYDKLLEFSEQELVDCDKSDAGCGGGYMDNAYRAIEKLGGLETEQDYPYEAENEKCHFNQTLARVQLSGALNISHNETDMAKWLVQNGPISIAINANAMQFYFGGVSHPWKVLCNPKNLDHGVLIVGYGVHKYPYLHKVLPYWIVKNSWGKSWGQQGYYLVYRGDGTCGLNQTPSSAVVA